MGVQIHSHNRGRILASAPYGVASSPATQAMGMLNLPDGGHLAPVETRSVTYRCLSGHDLPLRLAASASVPAVWECAIHRRPAPLADPASVAAAGAILADAQEEAKGFVPKTHWQHVLERRTIPELEGLLEERLAALRARRGELVDMADAA